MNKLKIGSVILSVCLAASMGSIAVGATDVDPESESDVSITGIATGYNYGFSIPSTISLDFDMTTHTFVDNTSAFKVEPLENPRGKASDMFKMEIQPKNPEGHETEGYLLVNENGATTTFTLDQATGESGKVLASRMWLGNEFVDPSSDIWVPVFQGGVVSDAGNYSGTVTYVATKEK